MSEFRYWQVCRPVRLLVICPEPEILLEPLVCPFGLTIHSWVIGCGDVLGNAQASAEFLCKLGCEACIPVAYDLQRESETFEYVVEIETSYAFCRDRLGTRDE